MSTLVANSRIYEHVSPVLYNLNRSRKTVSTNSIFSQSGRNILEVK